jgi:leucyl aminopeptidase (aminopeptidase T)
MELDRSLEPSPEWYWVEMGRVGRKIVEELFPIQQGENVVVTADTMSDWRVVQETVKAIYAVGAVPTLVVHPTTEMATANPPAPVAAALRAADAWIELNDSYLLYSDAWKEAMRAGVRFLSLGGDVDSLVRMVGRVDYSLLEKLAEKLLELSNKAKEIRITSELGTDLTIKVDAARSQGHVFKPGPGVIGTEGEGSSQMPPGQATFGHVPGGVEGVVVFDGALYPPVELGVLREPVRLEISGGVITRIEGGHEARVFEDWLAAFDHPGMYQVAHCSYGFNPGVNRCKGEIGHDERVFGGVEFGIGAAWAEAPAHSDGVVLRPTVWADEEELERHGRYTHPELRELCRLLGVSGY